MTPHRLPRLAAALTALALTSPAWAKSPKAPANEEKPAFHADAEVDPTAYERRGTDLASQDTQVTLGVNAGCHFDLGASFYATPWLGFGHAFGAEEVTLGGETFEQNPWVVFPAVHLGFRFR